MSSRAFLAVATVAALAAAAAPARAGTFRREELVVEGVTRELYVYTPETLAPGPRPVVLAFHGFQSDASGMRWLAKVDRYADSFGFIVIYPNAVDKSWNAGKGSGSTNRTTDDEAFAKALLADALARPEVDPKRIYAMGFSNGAQMVSTILCKLDHPLAAGAMVAHSLNIPGCDPKTRVPMVVMQGRKDPFVPFDGGGKSELASHADTVAFFRRLNETIDPPRNIVRLESITCTESVDKHKIERVVECIGEQDGHTWPGGVSFQPELFGKTNTELGATELIFSFFARHSGPAPKRTKPTGKSDGAPKAAATSKGAPSGAAKAAKGAPVAATAAAATAPAKPTPPAPKPAAAPPKPVEESRWREHSLTLASGAARRYFEPREGLLGARVLVLVFGDGAGTPDAIAAGLDLARAPRALGYVIVEAELAGAIDRVVGQLRDRLGAALPVSVVGVGAGGAIAQKLYCERPDLVTAVVMLAASFSGPPCTPRPMPSLLSVQAAKDARAPADGDSKRGLRSQLDLLVTWRNDLGVPLDPEVQTGPGYSCRGGRNPDGEPEIRTCRTESSDAGVPGGNQAVMARVVEFLERHQTKPEPFTIVHAR